MPEFTLHEIKGGPATAEALRHGRRLSDKILAAFHHACDIRAVGIAEELLGTLDRLIALPSSTEAHDRRKAVETLADANYRLWDVKGRLTEAPLGPMPHAG